MSLKLRRGTNAQRTGITPAEGELIYTTDTKKLYVGDGSTIGGIAVDTSGSGGGILLTDLSIGPENSASGDGSVSYDNTTGVFTYTPPIIPNNLSDLADVSSTTPITNQVLKFNGSSWGPANDTGITDIVQDTSPQLGGDLDINGHKFTTFNNNNIIIEPGGTGEVYVNKDLRLNGNIVKNSGQLTIRTTYINFGDASDPNSSTGFNVTRNGYTTTPGAGINFSQHHSNRDVVNFNFIRTRGTSNAPTSVVKGDDLGDLSFVGHTGTGFGQGAVISAIVESSPIPPNIATFLRFETNNGSSIASRAELSSSGVWKINRLSSLTGSTIELNTDNSLIIGDIQLNQNGLSSINSNANLYISANNSGRIYLDSLAWPNSDGLSGQVLTTDGAGTLSWTTASGGGGSSFSRTTVVGSTSSIAVGVSENVNITGASKGYLLYKIQVNEPAWVRIYVSDSARTADSSRAEGVDPAPGSGVIAEVITSSTNQVVLISPGTIGFNNESTVDSTIFLRVTNKAYTTAITSTLTIVSLET